MRDEIALWMLTPRVADHRCIRQASIESRYRSRTDSSRRSKVSFE
jgi:hypothetical protein